MLSVRCCVGKIRMLNNIPSFLFSRILSSQSFTSSQILWSYPYSCPSTRTLSNPELPYSQTRTLSNPELPYSQRYVSVPDPDQDEYYKMVGDSILVNRITRDPEIINRRISGFRSDIMAFSFFFACSRQSNFVHDDATFINMVGVISRLTERFETVKGILEHLDMADSLVKQETLFLLQRIYWFGGMYDRVVEVFDEIVKCDFTPSTSCIDIIMDVLLSTGHVETPLAALKETWVPNFLSYSSAIRNLCKLGYADNVRAVLKIMLRKGYIPYEPTLFWILNCFCKVGQIAEAKQIIDMMIVLGVPMSERYWIHLIKAYCQAGKLDVAYHLLEKMVKRGYLPDSEVCAPLIKGYFESEVPSNAFCVLDIMKANGCFPDLDICNDLLNYLIKVGRHDDAINTVSLLCDRGLMLGPDAICSLDTSMWLSKECPGLPLLQIFKREPKPDINPMMVNGLVRADNFDLAMSLIRRKASLDDVSYNIAISGLLLDDDLEGAYYLFSEMKEAGLYPSEQTYNLILVGFCKRSDASMVKYMLLEMGDASAEVHHSTLSLIKDLLERSNNSAYSPYKEIAMMTDKYLSSSQQPASEVE